MLMAIQYVPSSSKNVVHGDPELAEFKAMDLDAQLLKLGKLEITPRKCKSKAIDEELEIIRI